MSPKKTDQKIVAIITARGGSKGLIGKNVASLSGKPLITHTINAAKKSKLIDDVVVTTDDFVIEAVAKENDVKIINRPNDLAADDSSSYDAVKHALDTLKSDGQTHTHFILLQPTSPLRNEQHIDEALSGFLNTNYNSCMSICAVDHHPYKMLKINQNSALEPLQGAEHLDAPRQKLPDIYRQNGAIYIMGCDDFFHKTNNFYLEPVMPYVMDARSSVDIDTQADLDIAELYLSHD